MSDSSAPVRLLVATANTKKLEELRQLLCDFPVTLLGLKDFPDAREVEETGETFEANAELKALAYAEQTGCLTIGEDSGISCDALGGAPGVLSARFSGNDKNDSANNQKLLDSLSDVPDDKRNAHYTAAIALAEPGRVIGTVRGEVHGMILHETRGAGGFGYDPLFFYPPFQKTFAEVPIFMKHKVSHRSQALRKLRQVLQNYFKQSA